MSYLHCPACKCAYNVAHHSACPACHARPGAPADATDDVVQAAEQLARAIARATPAELAAAEQRLDERPFATLGVAARPTGRDRRALPAPGAADRPPAASLLRAMRAALSPPPPPPPDPHAQHTLLATVAIALLARLAAPRRSLVARARAWLR